MQSLWSRRKVRKLIENYKNIIDGYEESFFNLSQNPQFSKELLRALIFKAMNDELKSFCQSLDEIEKQDRWYRI